MFEICNKKDAVETMKRLGLNYFPLDVFEASNLDGIKNFFDKYGAKEYVLRNTDKADGEFFFVSSFEEAKNLLHNFDKTVTVGVSYNQYKSHIVLVGDVKVSKSYIEMVDLVARDDEDGTNRNVYENPKYNLHVSLDDDRIWKIPGFSKLMDYISNHELYDLIIEFIVYDKKVGIKKDYVVICEIRSSY